MQSTQGLAVELAEIQHQINMLDRRKRVVHAALHAEAIQRQRRIRQDMTKCGATDAALLPRATRPGDPVSHPSQRSTREDISVNDEFEVIDMLDLFSARRRT
ncbi:MAG: hypothetical protein AB8B82_10200 [Roseovarius sp.]